MVGLVAALVFSNSLWNEFAFDDQHIIVGNEAIQSLETLPGAVVAPYWPSVYGRENGLWRPTTTALLGLQYVVGDGSPVPFHVMNVLGHAAVSVLVLLLLAELMPLAAALAAGLLFAVHPVHVEAVANAIGIAEIASTAAILSACLIHVRGPATPGWGRALAVGAFYAIGFGAKESAVTLPGLIFLLDAARRRIGFGELRSYVRGTWRVYLVMLLVAAAILAARLAVLGRVAATLGPLGADLLEEVPRIWTLAEVWAHYVRLWIFPMDLSADYAPDLIPISIGWNAANTVGLGLALAVLTITLILWRRPVMGPTSSTSRAAAFGVVWFVIAVSPVSNIVFLTGVILAERILYLPSVGLAAATGWLVVRLARTRPRVAWAFLAVCLTLASARTWTRSPVWKNNFTLLTNLIEEYPQSGRSQWVLGDAFMGQGRVSEALVSYRAAISLLGPSYLLLTEVAKQLVSLERYRAAEVLLTIAWQDLPDFPTAPGMLATVRADLGDAAGAERWARASLALYRPDPARSQLLAWALAAQGRWEEAESEQAKLTGPSSVDVMWHHWLYLAYVRRRAGDMSGALAAVDSAWTRARTAVGRETLDSIRAHEFGLPARLEHRTEPEDLD